ncbi:microneme [Paramuricea clavata]|uniref:Microneme n=1 Tax=Paramuricea clavata TaxID=317549 RepID=A0A7D9IBC2_PARCT|nr:microneme [Paramuricea clavata]
MDSFPTSYTNRSTFELSIHFYSAGPNMNLTTYYLRTLKEVIPRMPERPSKNLHALLTNNQLFSALDLVRNLQVFPYQVKLLDKTTLMHLIFVSDEQNLTGNNTMLKSIAQIFLHQTDRLRMYVKSIELAKELNISFDDILQLSGLTKQVLLDSKPEVLEQVKKTVQIKNLLGKLTEYKRSLMTYKNNVQISLDVMKIRQHFNRLSLKKINSTTDKELKQILVGENKMIFTKTLSIRNISTFFDVSRASLKEMTVAHLLTQVLGISLENYTTLHMFTTHQLEGIKDVKISTVPSSDDMTLYEITNAILQLRTVKKCSESSCSKNAECIQHSNYSILCRCKKGYISNGFNCDTGNTIFSSELVLNQTFTESLNNPNSAEYRNLAEKIQNALTSAIRKENNFPGFLGCQVTGFIKGSVVAQYVLIFQLQESETVNASKLSLVVVAAVRNGSLAIPVVSSRSIKTADFCSLGFHSCHMHATCSIKDGIVTCTCKENYYGDGENCVDPCKQRQCPVHSYCFRGLNGQAKCICEPGYTQEEKGCEKADEDFKTALIIVSCVAGAFLLLTLMVCWYQYCNRNRKKSVEITSTTVANGRENTSFDTLDMDNL